MYIYKFTHISTGKWSEEAKAAHKIRMQEIANQKKLKGTT